MRCVLDLAPVGDPKGPNLSTDIPRPGVDAADRVGLVEIYNVASPGGAAVTYGAVPSDSLPSLDERVTPARDSASASPGPDSLLDLALRWFRFVAIPLALGITRHRAVGGHQLSRRMLLVHHLCGEASSVATSPIAPGAPPTRMAAHQGVAPLALVS
jgi:hypothetical protein